MDHEALRHKIATEAARWYLLLALDAGRPGYVNEGTLYLALEDVEVRVEGRIVHLELTHRDLRRELDYLEGRELIHIEDHEAPAWAAKISRVGIDVVEYTVPCDPGIARPKRD